MGLVAWFKNLWDNEEEEPTEYCCPKCGSEQIEYFSVISNYVQVIRGEDPKYINTAKCNNCGYSTNNIEDLKRKDEKTRV
jgi:predicted nucleic-acid-binding Zn-ribbon protein